MSKMIFSSFVLFLSLMPGIVSAQSFEGVTQFDAVKLYGTLSLTCFDHGRSENRYFQCSAETLEPMEVGYFWLDTTATANKVRLTATWTDGKVRTQELDFDSASGKSTKRANLWIETVFQRALLNVGANQVRYDLLQDGEVVQGGNFVVEIKWAENRSCRHVSDISHNPNDCQFASSACSRYFWRENYCQGN